MTVENFWGTLPDVSTLRSPSEILKEQATILTQITKGVVEGRVTARGGADQLALLLDVVVPSLGGYTYTILVVTHTIKFYPAFVQFPLRSINYNAQDETQFIGILKNILGSQEVKDIIASLMLQARQAR